MRKLIIKHFKISKNYYILRDIKVFSKKFFRLSPFVIMEIGAQGVEGACMRPVITSSYEIGPSPLQSTESRTPATCFRRAADAELSWS